MFVLGIHDGHNASAALLKDGRIVAGVQEERLRGVKNAAGTPRAAIREVLALVGLTPADVDCIALSGLHGAEYLGIDECAQPSEFILQRYEDAYKGRRIDVKRVVRRLIPDSVYESLRGNQVRQQRSAAVAALGFDRTRIRLVEHHTAHAASAYYGWGKLDEPILILTNDGMGDGICASVSIGQNGRFVRLASVPDSDSVAELYALTTFLLGMVPLEHEYKLMGMAPYASPSQAKKIAAELEKLTDFDKGNGLTWQRKSGIPMLSSAHRYLEVLYRHRRFDHICGGVQKFVEEFLQRWVRNAIRYTGLRKIALSGGIFMNVKANKMILEMDEVEDLFVFPSCGDETNAIGAAYFVYAEECRKAGRPVDIEPISNLYWGRDLCDDEIERAIAEFAFGTKVRVEVPRDIERRIAELLAAGHIVARHTGRMEFGARALGNRSILANAADSRVIKRINDMIKRRDFWMPFAPSVTVDRIQEYVLKPKNVPAPYMVLAFDSAPKKAPVFAAATHPYDATVRPQEVVESHNPRYYRLLQQYGDMTGEEILLNTSFNLHGYPIAYTAQQALFTLDTSGLEYLAIGSFLLSKQTS